MYMYIITDWVIFTILGSTIYTVVPYLEVIVGNKVMNDDCYLHVHVKLYTLHVHTLQVHVCTFTYI